MQATAVEIAFGFTLVILSLLSVISNGFVCIAIHTSKKVLLIYRIMAVQCFSDLITALAFVCTGFLCSVKFVNISRFTLAVCELNCVVFNASIFVSSICIGLSAIERWLKVSTAGHMKIRKLLGATLLVITWLPSLLLATIDIPGQAIFNYFGKKIYECRVAVEELKFLKDEEMLKTVSHVAINVMMPLVLSLAIYPAIIVKLRRLRGEAQRGRRPSLVGAKNMQELQDTIHMLIAITVAFVAVRVPIAVVGIFMQDRDGVLEH